MTRSLRLLPLALLLACNKGDDTDTLPPDDPADTDTGEDTDTDEEPQTVEHCPTLGKATGATLVQPGSSIAAALEAAKSGDVIALAAGTHNLTEPLVVTTPGITLRGETGDPDDVVVQGIQVPILLHVAASDFTLAGLTLKNGGTHGVLVEPIDAHVNDTIIDTVRIVDQGGEHVVIRGDESGTWYPDGGEIRCSSIELTDQGRKKVVGMCDTGGIRLHHGRGWTIRDNHLKGFWCPFGEAGWGIEVSEGARDVVVERNTVQDSIYGIALGLGPLITARAWADAPCEGEPLHAVSAIARNNIVFARDEDIFLTAERKPQVGIALENACESSALHNTIYSTVPHEVASLRMRFANTTGVVANNLTNGVIRRLDGAASLASTNVELAGDHSFLHVHGNNFRLAPAATDLIDQGNPEYTVADDIDGQLRVDGLPDIGADER